MRNLTEIYLKYYIHKVYSVTGFEGALNNLEEKVYMRN